MTMVYDGLEVDTWKLPLVVMCFSRPQHQFETNKTATLHATPLLEAAIQNTSCHAVYSHQSHLIFVYNFRT